MNEVEEAIYEEGRQMALLGILTYCLKEMGYENVTAQSARWVVEREQTLAVLRRLCREHGDNDWPNDLHLGDIIEKHLEPYIYHEVAAAPENSVS
jgi:protein-disulfide isomerase-like protein with CxxC motif